MRPLLRCLVGTLWSTLQTPSTRKRTITHLARGHRGLAHVLRFSGIHSLTSSFAGKSRSCLASALNRRHASLLAAISGSLASAPSRRHASLLAAISGSLASAPSRRHASLLAAMSVSVVAFQKDLRNGDVLF